MLRHLSIMALSGIVLFLFMTMPVHALGEKAEYNSTDNSYEIKSIFGTPLVELKLLESRCDSPATCYANIWVKATSDIKLDEKAVWKFYNGLDQEINIKQYSIQVMETLSWKENVTDKCTDKLIEPKNKSEENYYITECTQKEISRTRYIWSPLKELKSDVGYKIRLNGVRNINQEIEWIPTVYNEKLEKWAWWNDTWINYKPVTIPGANSALTNYSQFIEVVKEVPMTYNCSDVRWIDVDNTTRIRQNRDSWNDTVCNFWLELDNLGTNDRTIYMYYNASGVAEVDDTFNKPTKWYQMENYNGTGEIEIMGGSDGAYEDGNPVVSNTSWAFGPYINTTSHTEGRMTPGWSLGNNIDFTISMWVETGSYVETPYNSIESERDGTLGFLNTGVNTCGGFKQFYGDNNGAYNQTCYAVSPNNIDRDGDNHLLVMTYQETGGLWKTYVDGVQVINDGGRTWTPYGTHFILGRETTNNDYYDGRVDEYRYYANFVMSHDEVNRTFLNVNRSKVTFGAETSNAVLTSALVSPADNAESNATALDFSCSGIASAGAALVNITLYVWDAGDSIFTTTTNEVTGSENTSTFTSVGTFTEDTYQWNCLVTEDTPDAAFASANHTLIIDTTAPDPSILAPATTQVYDNLNQSLSYNWVESNTVSSCYYTLNSGSNVYLGCANTTFIGSTSESSSQFNNITIWINDTAGNLGSTSRQIGIANVSEIGYEPYVLEGESTPLNVTIKYDYDFPKDGGALVTPTVWLIWNNTRYSTSLLYNDDAFGEVSTMTLGTDLTIPYNSTTSNYTIQFNITFPAYSTAGYSSLESNFTSWSVTQQVDPIAIYPCTWNADNVTLNISGWNSDLLSNESFDLKYNFEYWIGSNATSKVLNGTSLAAHEHYLCISPSHSTFYTDALLQFYNSGSSTRTYHLVNATLSNSTADVKLYLLNQSRSTLVDVIVNNEYYAPVEGRYVHVLRYYPELNSYITVEISQSNLFGKALTHIYEEVPFYKFLVYDYTTLKKEVNPFQITCQSTPCEITFTEQPGSTNLYSTISGVSFNLSWNNNTEAFRWFWSDSGGLTSGGRLIVVKKSGLSDVPICDYTSTAASGTLVCDVTGNGTGWFVAQGFIQQSPDHISDTIDAIINPNAGAYGSDGVFWSLILIIAISVIGLTLGSIVFGFLAPIAVLFVVTWLGFVTILPSTIIGLLVLALFIISKVRSA